MTSPTEETVAATVPEETVEAGGIDADVEDPAAPGEPSGLRPAGEETWCLAVVTAVLHELPSTHPEVVVTESAMPHREIRIPVGLAEGTAIAYAFRCIETERPLTHALVLDLLDHHQVSIEALRVTARRGGRFFAELETQGPRGRQVVPCRPSDGIALVLRRAMPTPILVGDWVFPGEVPTPGT